MYLSFDQVEKMCHAGDGSFVGQKMHPADLHLFVEYNGELALDSGDFDGEGYDGLVLDTEGTILYYDGYFFSTRGNSIY